MSQEMARTKAQRQALILKKAAAAAKPGGGGARKAARPSVKEGGRVPVRGGGDGAAVGETPGEPDDGDSGDEGDGEEKKDGSEEGGDDDEGEKSEDETEGDEQGEAVAVAVAVSADGSSSTSSSSNSGGSDLAVVESVYDDDHEVTASDVEAMNDKELRRYVSDLKKTVNEQRKRAREREQERAALVAVPRTVNSFLNRPSLTGLLGVPDTHRYRARALPLFVPLAALILVSLCTHGHTFDIL